MSAVEVPMLLKLPKSESQSLLGTALHKLLQAALGAEQSAAYIAEGGNLRVYLVLTCNLLPECC
jgi:hypothetical protein